MITILLLALVALAHRLLSIDEPRSRGPVLIICPTCQRDVAPQVYHWHMESHRR